MQEQQAEETMARLRDLFPPGLASNSTDLDQSSFWTPQELATARLREIHRRMKGGWTFEDTGLLRKGNVTARPASLIAHGIPGEIGYNPRRDAFALRLGATFIEAGPNTGRYLLGDQVMDELGNFRDPQSCPECGSLHGEHRFKVRMKPNPNPFAMPWQQAFTYCRRCCSQDEIDELRRPAPARKKK